MKISIEQVEKIAHLARLEFDEAGKKEMQKSMTQILDWMDQLNELDTSNTPPLIHMSMEVNALREDKVKQHLSREAALMNAPKQDGTFILVPKVIV